MNSDEKGDRSAPSLKIPLTGSELLGIMSSPPDKEELRHYFESQTRRNLLEQLELDYRLYSRCPTKHGRVFRVQRALLRACRSFGLTAEHAALFIELGTIGDGAKSSLKLALTRRPETKTLRKISREGRTRTRQQFADDRDASLFRAALFYLSERGGTKDDALQAAVDQWNVYNPSQQIGVDTADKAWRANSRRLRNDGIEQVQYETAGQTKFLIIKNGPGRPKKGK